MTNENLYRPCVGICLFNREGNVFVGERLDNPGAWQMPQGGIDEGEDIETAARREMLEEIGTDKATLLTIMPRKLRYETPLDIRPRLQKIWGHPYIGQEQTWVALRFTGADTDINLTAHDPAEFGRWQWVALKDVTKLIVPFKVKTYEEVVSAFAAIK